MVPRLAVAFVFVLSITLMAADEKANELKLDSGVAITAPEGYSWKKVGEQERNGKKGLMYLATHEQMPTKLFVAIEPETADTDAKRIARLKGFYNGIVGPLKGKAKDLKAPPPDLNPPIPDRVQFVVSGNVNDSPLVVVAQMIFGKSTYHVQAGAPTEEEAMKLIKVTEVIKE